MEERALGFHSITHDGQGRAKHFPRTIISQERVIKKIRRSVLSHRGASGSSFGATHGLASSPIFGMVCRALTQGDGFQAFHFHAHVFLGIWNQSAFNPARW